MARRKNKSINILFVVIILGILGYLYYRYNGGFFPVKNTSIENKTAERVSDASFGDDIKIETKTLAQKETWYKEITVQYPEGDVAGVAEVKKFVFDEISQLWCQNDDEHVSESDAKKTTVDYECSLDIKYSYTNNHKLISHKLAEYGMYGGMHGIYTAETFTYDTNGTKLALADIILNKDTYKKALVEKLKVGFKKYEKENKSLNVDINEIVNEGAIDMLPFIVTKTGITFLFSGMTGLSFGAGEVEIPLSFAELTGIIKPQFLN